MSVIDSHHHFWWREKHTYAWPPLAAGKLDRNFAPDDLAPELAACGIDGTVLIQVQHNTVETAEYLDIARTAGFVRGVVGWVPLADPSAAASALDDLKGRGKLVGIRHLISNEPDPEWLLQSSVQESLRRLVALGLAFDAIPINPRQLDAVIGTAKRHPDLAVVINHLGRPPVPDQGWEPWAEQIARAAECPNVSMKLSAGLDIVLRWRWSNDGIRRYVDHVLERFGADRVMAASNWPVILLGGSFQEVWHGIEALIARLSEPERRAILGGTAERVYGL
jgi:L-fucono-1,5-lactonase